MERTVKVGPTCLRWEPLLERVRGPWALTASCPCLAPALLVLFFLLHLSLSPVSKMPLFWACSSSPPFLKAPLVVLWVLRGRGKEAHIY